MSLNIKNEHTHALVRELAALTGMSQTSAVEDAVRRRLDELTAQQRARRRRPEPKFPPEEVERRIAAMKRIGEEFRADMEEHPGPSLWEIMDDLYDEQGLPK